MSLGSKLQALLIRNDILYPGFSHSYVTYAVILENCCFMHLMKTGKIITAAAGHSGYFANEKETIS